MKLDPFIEAEKIAGHSVAKTCGLFEVSRSAYYERTNGVPSDRQVGDAELTKQIKDIHDESKGTYGAPRIHQALRQRQVACGKRRVTRLMRIAGLEGRCKKRWRTTTVADPEAEAARDLAYRLFVSAERRGWAADALAFNALVTAWPELTRLAAAQRGPVQETML